MMQRQSDGITDQEILSQVQQKGDFKLADYLLTDSLYPGTN